MLSLLNIKLCLDIFRKRDIDTKVYVIENLLNVFHFSLSALRSA